MALARIDLAIASDGVLAIVPGVGGAVSVDARLGGGDVDPGSLYRALGRLEREILDALGVSGEDRHPKFSARVALLPPLSEVRIVELPDLGAVETDLILRRNTARYFLGMGRDLVVGSRRLPGVGDGTAPVLAAVASARLLDSVREAVAALGWELEEVVPALPAWLGMLTLQGAKGTDAGTGRGAIRVVVAVDGGTAHLVRLHGATPLAVRRVPAADTAGIVDAMGVAHGRALLLAGDPSRAAIRSALQEAGWKVEDGGDAREAAARGISAAGVELVPTQVAEARERRSRGAMVRLLGIAAALIVAAAVVHLWSLARSTSAVERERQALRSEVAPVALVRDSLQAVQETLAGLRVLEESARSLTLPLVELSVLLPPESHLVSLRVAGDTAVFEAVGGRAGLALSVLRQAQTFSDVRIEGTIQRDIEAGSTAGERFVLSALLVPAIPAEQWESEVGQ